MPARFAAPFKLASAVIPPGQSRHLALKISETSLAEPVVRRCDFGIDLHTAGGGRLNLPHVRDDMGDPAVRKLAKGFGPAVIVDQRGLRGSLRREATEAGIPTILFEAGEPDRFDIGVSRAGYKGMINLLCHLGMWPAKAEPGDLVYAGDVIGEILDPRGRRVTEIQTQLTGMIIGTSVQPVASPGSAIAYVAELKRTLARVERSFVELRRSWKASVRRARAHRRPQAA